MTAVLAALVVYGLATTIGASRHRARRTPVIPNRPAGPPVSTAGSAPAPAGDTGGTDALAPVAEWSLPGPSRFEGVAAVGYPHTTLGALALGYSALAARYTTDPDIAVSVIRATVLRPSITLLRAVAHGTEALRTRFGLAPTGPTPTTIGLSLIACQVTSASPSRVVAGYEGTLSVEGGSAQGTTAEVSASIVLAWDGADWKIDSTANLPTPPIEFPTSAGGATAGGWHVCAEV
jgi:hypothetical protein